MLPRLCQEVHPGLDPLREVSEPGLVWGLEGVVWGEGFRKPGLCHFLPHPQVLLGNSWTWKMNIRGGTPPAVWNEGRYQPSR